MYGDTQVIRGLARDLRDQATEVRQEASMLITRAETTIWSGLAAEAMRAQAHARAKALRHTADLHDDAAAALKEHADAVDKLKALIATIEAKVTALVAAARDRLAGLVASVMPDPVDELLDRFVPPPSGHKDWLVVDLPGLA